MTGHPVPSHPPGQRADDAGSPGSRDYGLFGPDSVTWRVLSEPVMWIAGVRAMYMQALHPRVMLGTWQNTALAKPDEAWGRFTRTVEFVRVRTYGTTPEVNRAGARLRKVHSSLTGVDADGSRFRLDEPELLLWVHCAEIGSYAEIARRSGVHVTAAELDAFVDEQRRSAEVVGLSRSIVPASMAELEGYNQRMRPRLRASARRASGRVTSDRFSALATVLPIFASGAPWCGEPRQMICDVRAGQPMPSAAASACARRPTRPPMLWPISTQSSTCGAASATRSSSSAN